MEKIVEQGILYDFYGALLTKHQQEIYEAVVYENLSLGEIASEKGISRQGVHDLIKRCDKILEEYESKLHLVQRFSQNRKNLLEIRNYVAKNASTDLSSVSKEENISDIGKSDMGERNGEESKSLKAKEILQLIDDMIEEL